MADIQNYQEHPSKIFKLDFDALEAVFDFLPLKDLIAVGRSCEDMQKFVGNCIMLKYRSNQTICTGNGILMNNININDFSKFVRNLTIWLGGLEIYRWINASSFESVEQINLFYVPLTTTGCIMNMLSVIKTIELHHCTTEDDFYDTFLKFCANLQRIWIKQRLVRNTVIGANNNWMLRRYPELKHIGLELTKEMPEINELVTFLQHNPGITSFSVNSDLFCANMSAFLASNIKLDVLIVKVQNSRSYNIQSLLNNLIELQTHNLFRRLGLVFEHFVINEEMVNQMASLANLTELHINDASNIININALVQNLVGLKRVVFRFIFMDELLPFIRYSTNLMEATVKLLGSGVHFENGFLNLMRLNHEREMLEGAHKVAIYVTDEIYIGAKTVQVDSSLIELKRLESHARPMEHFD